MEAPNGKITDPDPTFTGCARGFPDDPDLFVADVIPRSIDDGGTHPGYGHHRIALEDGSRSAVFTFSLRTGSLMESREVA